MKLAITAFLMACLGHALALPGGAPAQACMDLTPRHGGNTPRPNPSSNRINIDDFVFNDTNGTELVYVPGGSYTITLSNIAGGTFRGFLIQARDVDGKVKGTFSTPVSSNARLSSCTPANGGVTHDNTERIDFSEMEFTWTAPSEDVGPLRFHYSTVRVFDTFWVNETTDFIQGSMAPPTPTPTATPTPTPITPTGGASITVVSLWSTLAVAMAVAVKNML